MKVVLLQNVKGVGQKGQVKEVSEGHARNLLIPRGLAKAGTEQTLKEVHKISKDKEDRDTRVREKIEEAFFELSDQHFSFPVKINTNGALFAKFDEKNILQELHKKGFKIITLKQISLIGSPLKHKGDYLVVLKDGSVTSTFKITVG